MKKHIGNLILQLKEIVEEKGMGAVKVDRSEVGKYDSEIQALHAPDYEAGFLRHSLESEEWITDYVCGSAFDLKSHYAVEANAGDVYISEHYEDGYCPVQDHHKLCSI